MTGINNKVADCWLLLLSLAEANQRANKERSTSGVSVTN